MDNTQTDTTGGGGWITASRDGIAVRSLAVVCVIRSEGFNMVFIFDNCFVFLCLGHFLR